MSDASGAVSQANKGRWANGPVTIDWRVQGEHNSDVAIVMSFESTSVGKNTLSPGNTNWRTGRHSNRNSWVQAEFDLQVPTPGQNGQLELLSLEWEQNGPPQQAIKNLMLERWSY
jgi:hypothetical protein